LIAELSIVEIGLSDLKSRLVISEPVTTISPAGGWESSAFAAV